MWTPTEGVGGSGCPVLFAGEKISPRLVEIMQNWAHPGFSVFQSLVSHLGLKKLDSLSVTSLHSTKKDHQNHAAILA
jgi:hypothetical protein